VEQVKKRIFIFSSIEDDFGGSEILWFDLAKNHLHNHFQVFVLKRKVNRSHPFIQELQKLGIHVIELSPDLGKDEFGDPISTDLNSAIKNYCIHLQVYNPDLVVINQGVNFDGLEFANSCRDLNYPYFIISHKAIDIFWPYEGDREVYSKVWQKSRANFFVSDINHQITSEQFGMMIPNAQRAYNPIKRYEQRLKFPDFDLIKFACIGRLYLLDKGQDLLLRILSKPIWRQRNFKVSIIGTGPDETALKELAEFYELNNVEFLGHLNNETIWDSFHGLLLPSRNEGFPLVVQEAMAASRIVVATKAGGSQEIIEDGKNGFISKCFQNDFELAMERCWQSQNNWQQIAQNAFQTIDNYIPNQPTSNILELISQILDEK
jgi:glycosyltransferase involved in cell wall biosynthesis